MVGVVEADGLGNFGDGAVGFFKEFCAFFDSELDDVVKNACVHAALEEAAAFFLAKIDCRGDVVQRDAVFVIQFDISDD